MTLWKAYSRKRWVCLFYFVSLSTIYYQVWLNQYRWGVPHNCFHLHIFITGKMKNFCIYWFELQDMWMNICINTYICGGLAINLYLLPSRQERSGFTLTEPKNIWGCLQKNGGGAKWKENASFLNKTIQLFEENLQSCGTLWKEMGYQAIPRYLYPTLCLI